MRFMIFRSPGKALPSQVFQAVVKVIKGQRAHFVSRPDPKGYILEAQGAQCPSPEA